MTRTSASGPDWSGADTFSLMSTSVSAASAASRSAVTKGSCPRGAASPASTARPRIALTWAFTYAPATKLNTLCRTGFPPEPSVSVRRRAWPSMPGTMPW